MIRLNLAIDLIARKIRYSKDVGDPGVQFDRDEAEQVLNDLKVFRDQVGSVSDSASAERADATRRSAAPDKNSHDLETPMTTLRDKIIQAALDARNDDSIHITEIEKIFPSALAAACTALREAKAKFEELRNQQFMNVHRLEGNVCCRHATEILDALLTELDPGPETTP